MSETTSSCCSSTPAPAQSCCCKGSAQPRILTSGISLHDRFGSIMCRTSNKFRMHYRINPGLYAVGNPGPDAPVLVTANYRLSVNHVRVALRRHSAWILILDTHGINVWCAAGKGTFGTDELVRQINTTQLKKHVNHTTVIVPQLGAPGVAAHRVQQETGFRVTYGPVYASDIPEYLDINNITTPCMRRVHFSVVDRMKLIPMEVFPAVKECSLFLLLMALLLGMNRTGILYKQAVLGVYPLFMATATALFTGSFLVPLLLPWIPFRAFTIKGLLAGIAGCIGLVVAMPVFRTDPYLFGVCVLGIPVYSSYRAFLFTGSTTYTGPSGVKKELKAAWPAYRISMGIVATGLVLVLLHHWRIV